MIREEEDAFLRTLDKGIRLMDSILENRQKASKFRCRCIHTLRYIWVPHRLERTHCQGKGYTIDMKGFEIELGKQRERARCATAIEEGDWYEVAPFTSTHFVGYDTRS